MSNPNFIDYIKIFCKSGNGGSGSSHFRREKFVPKGGPDGGDGGKGGNIILKGNSQLWTLLHLRYTKHLTAENGGDGSGSKKHGKDGKNIIIEVPLGTIAKSDENDEKILEILNEIVRDLKNHELEIRISDLESKFSKDLSEATFNELKELKKQQKIN